MRCARSGAGRFEIRPKDTQLEQRLDQEQAREYRRLQDDMTTKLRHHAFVDDRGSLHAFQYLVLPSFTPPVAWDVFRRRRRNQDDDFVLVRSCWRSDLDLEKLQTPVERLRHPYPLIPTIEVHQLTCASRELARLAAELAAMKLPVGAPASAFGCDGVTFEIAIEQPPHYIALAAKCRLSWWDKPPEGWEALAAWVQRAESIFEGAWATQGAAAPTPLRVMAIEDATARHEAQRLFHAGHYGLVAELLAEVSTREKLTPAEAKMLELALKRAGDSNAV